MLQHIKNYFKTPKGFGQLVNTMGIVAPQKAAAFAFEIFCTPRKGRTYTTRQEQLLAKASQERVPLQDFELQTYVWEGGKEKILLVHGWDSNAARWNAVISTLLSENYTVIAFDAPGHGKSGHNKINGVLYAQALEKVVQRFQPDYVVGHSFGGMAAVHYFANFDALPIKRLILMATPSTLDRILGDYYKMINLSKRIQKGISDYFQSTFGFDTSYFSMEDFIKKVDINGIVLHDPKDPITPFREGEAICGNWKGATIHTFEDIGHSLQNRAVYRKIVEEIKKG